MALNDNFKGAFLMAAAMAGFNINDAMVKLVTPLMNVGQIMLIRGAMTTLLVILIAWRLGALRPFRVAMNPVIGLRMIGETVSSITYLTALTMIPLANAASILQALPLAVTLGAAVFFKEPVGWRRWSAILAGFIGVLIIIRPGTSGFSQASMLVVICVMGAALRDLTSKRIDADIPSLFITVISSLTVTVIGGLLVVPYGGWQPVTLEGFLPLVWGSLMLFVGLQSIVMSMRIAEMSFIAPYRYTSLLWSILLGYLLFGDVPDGWMLVGSAIVVAAGLYAFYRESKRHRLMAAQNFDPTAS